MFHNLNLPSNMPERLYRSPSEIRIDMKRIADGMTRIDSMLSVHSLRISLFGEDSVEELRKKILELRSAVSHADKSLRLLTRFESAVAELGRELDGVICALRG